MPPNPQPSSGAEHAFDAAVSIPRADAPAGAAARFPTTQWSLVLHAGSGADPAGHAALTTLCRRYWYPLYAFVRRQGRAHHEAEDCTQEFLAVLLARDGLARVRPERGHFRGFLLTALRNFLTTEWRRAHAARRAGDQPPLSLEFARAENRFALEPVDPALTPEQAFDRAWAQDVIARAVAGLRDEYHASGRGALFDALGPCIWGQAADTTLVDRAVPLGMSAHALTMALHRLRRRVGERLRADIANTVADGGDVDAELRHLIAAVSAPPA